MEGIGKELTSGSSIHEGSESPDKKEQDEHPGRQELARASGIDQGNESADKKEQEEERSERQDLTLSGILHGNISTDQTEEEEQGRLYTHDEHHQTAIIGRLTQNESASGSRSASELYHEQENERCLLPRLKHMDDLVVEKIATRVSLDGIQILTQVNRGWRRVIRNGEVRDARRMTGHARELLIPFLHSAYEGTALAAYSLSVFDTRGNCWYRIPFSEDALSGFLDGCQCVSFDTKVYILGGISPDNDDIFSCSRQISCLDLALGSVAWTRCVDMQVARSHFACGVHEGKVYIFGGVTMLGSLNTAEVFDHQENRSLAIAQMPELEALQNVTEVGGIFYTWSDKLLSKYNPVIDEWKDILLANFDETLPPEAFVQWNNKLHKICPTRTFTCNEESSGWDYIESIRWTESQPIIWKGLQLELMPIDRVIKVSTGQGYVLAVARPEGNDYDALFRSQLGFGPAGTEMVFEQISAPEYVLLVMLG